VGRVHDAQKVELLAPKDHLSDLNVAFQEIVDIDAKKVNIFPWLSSNRLLACFPIVLCMMLWVVASVPQLCVRFVLAKHYD
jgi:hypothetical protein